MLRFYMEEQISQGEEIFERWRRTLGLFIGPAVFLFLIFWPTPSLNPKAHLLGAVLAFVIIFWITEPIPIPVTALLGPSLCVLLGVAPAKQVMAPFADPIVFLFIGSFMIARAMMLYQLDRRFALALFAIPWVGNNAIRLFVTCGATTVLISMWVNNTSTTAMMYPIVLGILSAMGELLSARTGTTVNLIRTRFATGMMLMIAYGASIGGLGTPVGSAPNLIGIGMIETMIGEKITFFQWMVLCLPIVLVMFIILAVLLFRLHPTPVKTIEGVKERIQVVRDSLGPWNRGQIFALTSFLTAVVLWITPGIAAVSAGTDSSLYQTIDDHLNEGISALAAAALLFILPLNWKRREFALSWQEAVRIDWGTILLFGGGLSLGKLMFDTRLAESIGNLLLSATGMDGLWGITAFAILFAIIVSETTSNTASASMVVPVVIAIAVTAHVSPLPPALGATIGASFGFLLPVSTPPNAIIYGSGLVPIRAMIRAGIWFDFLGFLVIWGGLRILCPIMGLTG
ncbi:MAG: DASS family sodium-coupled anion symporter [Nitrospirae bacterium]|nr:DASS family sodium-coupled anion symporter [Nitrospirota bacterium]